MLVKTHLAKFGLHIRTAQMKTQQPSSEDAQETLEEQEIPHNEQPFRTLKQVIDADWCTAAHCQHMKSSEVLYPRNAGKLPARLGRSALVPAPNSSAAFKMAFRGFVSNTSIIHLTIRDAMVSATSLVDAENAELRSAEKSRSVAAWLLVPPKEMKKRNAFALIDAITEVLKPQVEESKLRATILLDEDAEKAASALKITLDEAGPTLLLRQSKGEKNVLTLSTTVDMRYTTNLLSVAGAIQNSLHSLSRAADIDLSPALWKNLRSCEIEDAFRRHVQKTQNKFERLVRPNPHLRVQGTDWAKCITGALPGEVFANVMVRVTPWKEVEERAKQASQTPEASNSDAETIWCSVTMGEWCKSAFPGLLLCASGIDNVRAAQKYAALSADGGADWHVKPPKTIPEQILRMHILAIQVRTKDVADRVCQFVQGCEYGKVPTTVGAEHVAVMPVDEALISQFCVQPCSPECLVPKHDCLVEPATGVLTRLCDAVTVTFDASKRTMANQITSDASTFISKLDVSQTFQPLADHEALTHSTVGNAIHHLASKSGGGSDPLTYLMTACATLYGVDAKVTDAIQGIVKLATNNVTKSTSKTSNFFSHKRVKRTHLTEEQATASSRRDSPYTNTAPSTIGNQNP